MTPSAPASGADVSLLSDARNEAIRKGPPCSVSIFFRRYPELADELREAMISEVRSTAISAALKRRAIDLSELSIARHRRGACRCQA